MIVRRKILGRYLVRNYISVITIQIDWVLDWLQLKLCILFLSSLQEVCVERIHAFVHFVLFETPCLLGQMTNAAFVSILVSSCQS